MKFLGIASALLIVFLVLPVAGFAQIDNFGKLDTVYADIARIDDNNWSITISYFNDEVVEGLSVPLKMTAGVNRIVADSAVYTGGRVDNFTLKAFRPDTAIQCVTLGMVANLGPTKNSLPPGTGRLVTVFVSSLEDKAIEKLTVDTTTTHPNNSLMVVANRSVWGEHSLDTITVEKRKELEIRPHFLVRQAK
jgi:hypothetical protein